MTRTRRNLLLVTGFLLLAAAGTWAAFRFLIGEAPPAQPEYLPRADAAAVPTTSPGPVSVFTRFDVPMFTWRDGLQRQAVEWKRRPVMLRGGVCA